MALPYPTKVVLPFDIATAQDMNERHANDVALAAGTGLNDGAIVTSKLANNAITASKLDYTTLAFGNYSTSEVDTGFKWIDGKTIYKKTVDIGNLPNAQNKTVAHGITGTFIVLSISGHATNDTNTTQFPLPYVAISPADSVLVNRANSILQIQTGSNRSNYSGYITLTYIKL